MTTELTFEKIYLMLPSVADRISKSDLSYLLLCLPLNAYGTLRHLIVILSDASLARVCVCVCVHVFVCVCERE